jgi:hypothetical protein
MTIPNRFCCPLEPPMNSPSHRLSPTPVVLVLLSLFGLVGCWTDGEMVDYAVWSDDDTGQAYIKLLYEEGPKVNPLSQTHPRRNFRHQVYVQNTDGSGRRAVTDVRPHRTGNNIFYMRGEGYLIVDVFETEAMARYDIIDAASGETATILRHTLSDRACTSHEVIPSYTGHTLAVVERTAGSDSGGRCPSGEVVVTFLDADSLSTLSSYRWPVTDMIQVAWTEADQIVVLAPADGAWRVDPAGGPVAIDPPECIYPRTTSGNVSADGVVIGGGMSVDDPITVFPPFPEGDPYGCSG